MGLPFCLRAAPIFRHSSSVGGAVGIHGTDKPWLSPAEERVHRAVARAARRTGLAISSHAVMSDVGLAQLRRDGYEEPPLVTLGADLGSAHDMARLHPDGWTSAQAVEWLTGRPAQV